jgi:competence protein ComEC
MKGEVKIQVLWPRQSFDSYQVLPGDGSSINNSSIALLISVNNLKIFATGDIEPPVQEEIFRSNRLTEVDILKVPHHGSAYQFAPLLEQVHPKISLISVGVGNKYGHPALKTISLLRNLGSRVLRTDQDGAISVDPSLSIRTKKSDWWDISWG